MTAPDRVLLFLKAPRPGTVKTRLAADLGNDAATAVYRRLTERQIAAVHAAGLPLELHFAPADAEPELRAWLGDTAGHFIPQCAGDLGARLAHATALAFADGAARVALIGTDCPALDAARLQSAFNALTTAPADAVFGPARDGGYYLLALSAPHLDLFSDIPWSTADTLRVSLALAETSALRTALLPEEDDIDDIHSLRLHPDLWRRAQSA
jgi:rSAM/selenodomain-associated transferase 1